MPLFCLLMCGTAACKNCPNDQTWNEIGSLGGESNVLFPFLYIQTITHINCCFYFGSTLNLIQTARCIYPTHSIFSATNEIIILISILKLSTFLFWTFNYLKLKNVIKFIYIDGLYLSLLSGFNYSI